MDTALQVCLGCNERGPAGPGGCKCKIDPQGRTINEIAELVDCTIGKHKIVATPRTPLPLQEIPDDFDPEQERRRMQQGGCCG